MSERKTAEIKLRVTPSFKAAVRLAAEQAGETMSVYIEKATQDRISEDEAATLHVSKSDPNWQPANPTFASGDLAWRFARQFSTNLNPVTPVALTVVPAKSADGACEKNCPPWQWCECKRG